MGAFSFLTIADYPTFDYKNEYYREVVNHLFLPEDFVCERRPYSSKNKLYWGDAYDDEKGMFLFKGFRQTAGVCKRRLEIFGTDLLSVRSDWDNAKIIASENGWHNAEYDFNIKKVSFSDYRNELANILTNKIITYEQERDNLHNSLIADGLVICGQSIPEGLYSILSLVSDDAIVEYDLTDISSAGWIKAEKVKDDIRFQKIIVLTEGKSDSEILETTLKLLYPELFPYYHFIDFGGFKVEGGASALVRTVKAFAAANVNHPIIALFDNDTAGISEMNKIPKKLPNNIKALKLPDIEIAKNFATLGPTGIAKVDVNGMACGIEIYLGAEVLSKNGQFPLIRWSSFDNGLQRYQGYFENKDELHSRFWQFVKDGKEWQMPEMKLIWESIFNAFCSVDNKD